MNYTQQFEIQQEVGDIIDDVLGEEISDAQRDELTNDISFLLNKYTKEYSRSLNSQYYEDTNTPLTNYYPNSNNFNPYNQFSHPQFPAPNPFLPPAFNNLPQNPFLPPTFNSLQQNPFPSPTFNYLQQNSLSPITPTMMAPNPYLMQMFQQTQQLLFDQFSILNQTPVIRKKSKRKSRSKSQPKSKSKSKSTKTKSVKKEKSESSESESDSKDDQTPTKSEPTKKDDSSEIQIIERSYDPSSPFNGIFKYLTDQNHGSPPGSDIIKLSANCPTRGNAPARNVLTNDNTDFAGMKTSNLTISFTFMTNEIEITNYSMKRGNIGNQISSWTLEISEDGSNWIQIDRRSNELNEVSTFSITNSSNRFVSYCRFTNIQFSSANGNSNGGEFSVRSIEFFGRIKKRKLPISDSNGFGSLKPAFSGNHFSTKPATSTFSKPVTATFSTPKRFSGFGSSNRPATGFAGFAGKKSPFS